MLFEQGVEQGSNTVSIQQGVYVAEYDFTASATHSFSLEFDQGDEIFDLTTPTAPLAPAGVYLLSQTVTWAENEAGATGTLEITGLSATSPVTMFDLEITSPGGTGGVTHFAPSGFAMDDGVTTGFQLFHDRAGGNLTGGTNLVVIRLY